MIDRKPIVLNKNNVALILIYHKSDNLLDVSLGALDSFISEETAESAAREFISQLEGSWTPRFMRALRSEIDRVLGRGLQAPKHRLQSTIASQPIPTYDSTIVCEGEEGTRDR